jgi:hypothetical protein
MGGVSAGVAARNVASSHGVSGVSKREIRFPTCRALVGPRDASNTPAITSRARPRLAPAIACLPSQRVVRLFMRAPFPAGPRTFEVVCGFKCTAPSMRDLRARGAHARSAGARASARTSADGTEAKSSGARASASTSAHERERHQRLRSKCNECGGAGGRGQMICPHERLRSQCKGCGGSICPHERLRSQCKDCSEEVDKSMPAGLEELEGAAHAAGQDR